MVYDRSMKMDGPCAVNRCMTDGKLENVEFFLDFLTLVGLLPAGDMYIFLIFVTSIIICLINTTQINISPRKWIILSQNIK